MNHFIIFISIWQISKSYFIRRLGRFYKFSKLFASVLLPSAAPLVQWCPAAPWLGMQCAQGISTQTGCAASSLIISPTGKLKDPSWSSIFGFSSPLLKVRSSLWSTVTLWDWWSLTKRTTPFPPSTIKGFSVSHPYCRDLNILQIPLCEVINFQCFRLTDASTPVLGFLLFTRRHSLYSNISCRSKSQADFLPQSQKVPS